MAKGKAACERLGSITVVNPTSAEATSAAVNAYLISEDPELSQDVRAEAAARARELAGAPTAEDATRRMQLMQKAARLGRTNS